MKKIIFIILLIFPFFAFAQDASFQAEVIEILAEQNTVLPDGQEVFQQNVKLKGLSGDFKDEEVVFEGIGDYDVVKKNLYEVGDKVIVVENMSHDGSREYYITDYVRTSPIYYLLGIFFVIMIAVGRWKGIRAILSLVLSFLVIIKYIIPQILSGADPIVVSIIGSFLILLIVVYLTEGYSKKSHIASISIFVSLILTMVLSWFFVEIARLSGLGSEEISYLVSLDIFTINFQGLLLASIIIGTLGVLDDVVISQISTVEELINSGVKIKKEIFSSAYKVGVSHISSMTNTLFLAYAGASFPLLILFVSGQSAFSGLTDVINNEAIATEIVRTLAGSIGLVLSVPISTWMGVVFLKK
ncbi:hypothetical protein C0583_04465 [Candidatus Parcubacteria bacterium]|nr:MAG: hypothetical protein C0583_04465 [Candidatus Parcubacteria bacterium]